jgi:hypothetical protein
MEEELGGNFVIAVDELGVTGLWTTIKDVSIYAAELGDAAVTGSQCDPDKRSVLLLTHNTRRSSHPPPAIPNGPSIPAAPVRTAAGGAHTAAGADALQ